MIRNWILKISFFPQNEVLARHQHRQNDCSSVLLSLILNALLQAPASFLKCHHKAYQTISVPQSQISGDLSVRFAC